MSLFRRVVQVSGVATELLGISASNGAPKLQVLFIPGNPGSAQYYAMQMQLLHSQLDGVEVLAVSHAGHDPALAAAGGHLWSLQEQIQHKADFIRQYLLLPGRPPLVVAGHSIGAYMAVQAVVYAESSLDSLTSEAARPPIVKVLGLFPFFWIDRTQWKIRLLRMAASCYEVMGRVAQVISLLPAWLQLAVIRHFSKGLDAEAMRTTQQLITRSSVRNNFYLAHTEFQDLDQPPPWHLLKGLGHRLHVLGCPEDVWMTKAQYHEMQQQVEGLQATWVEEVRHAYCTSAVQCQRVTEIVSEIISGQFEQQQQQQWQRPRNSVALLVDGPDAATGAVDLEVQIDMEAAAPSKSKL